MPGLVTLGSVVSGVSVSSGSVVVVEPLEELPEELPPEEELPEELLPEPLEELLPEEEPPPEELPLVRMCRLLREISAS